MGSQAVECTLGGVQYQYPVIDCSVDLVQIQPLSFHSIHILRSMMGIRSSFRIRILRIRMMDIRSIRSIEHQSQ
ncbi:hypothetical protein GCK72_018284 [Caenorhabditis remanei]|uniref:Uncharacterized protein n=1 Tax=Caenorhabditis remanei TaxID=31234 RepID=A0A6A5G9L7_CAERE|nr:hypothetical protein GCK72_018284 [Caenorhabditis remanei]KAF1751730.1 hypothetical protein GCK72_018284 [Caenorhabditis remanei]